MEVGDSTVCIDLIIDDSIPFLKGENAEMIIQKYELNDFIKSGSSSNIYNGNDYTIRRLSTDAGSHNIVVQGYKAGLSFPKIYANYGAVGISDEDSDNRYWLMDVEKCICLSSNFDKCKLLISALYDVCNVLDESDKQDYVLAREYLDKYKNVFECFSLNPTLAYILTFAREYALDVDVSPSNFMLNQEGNVVATDPVYGHEPDNFM